MIAQPSIPIVRTIDEVREAVGKARRAGLRIGLVPTMGALHAGHLKLVEEAREASEFVVVSIFVNPTQFGPNEDFRRYPRTLEADVELSARGGAALIFAPDVEEMYPSGPSSTFVDVPGLSETLEGASRPGHFRGVATVVLKLFTIVGADLAFFGSKDYQQLQVIRRMVADLNIPIEIQAVATVREPDGLAMSSRNRYLDANERRAAVVLSKALGKASEAVRSGERDADRVRQILRETIESETMAMIDYAEVADADTLSPARAVGEGQRVVALLAVKVGPARLIDNAILLESSP
jgi:pantoate--beta-alanine ligase